jgi:CxxC motif-containing protein (DUF1111 family)
MRLLHSHPILLILLVTTSCGDNDTFVPAAGGDTTLSDRSSRAFANPSGNLNEEEFNKHALGDIAFGAKFVTAPAPINGGLGPLYNSNACELCHTKNGRGLPHLGTGSSSQALIRVSMVGGTADHPNGAVPVPGFGTQLQDHAIFGYQAEVAIDLQWRDIPGTFGDGSPYALRAPMVTVQRSDGTAMPENVLYSMRIAPAVFGLGLLEAIPAADLQAAADPDDQNQDGISGRPNYVWDEAAQDARIGRFGAKANNPNLHQQAAAAFVNDMGVTNPMFHDGAATPDIDQEILEVAAFYTATLGVPERLPLSPLAKRGEALFAELNCATCHQPVQRTLDSPIEALRNQTFAPYTDLLLHDMGPELADNRPDFLATGQEWRTTPLWGLGAVPTVLQNAGYLHDGRARTVTEAILWHGGEAARSRELFRTASAAQREALLAFLAAL